MACNSIRNPSLCLARQLDQIIGTEDHVRISQQMILLTDYLMNPTKTKSLVSTGSHAEGYLLESSDVDQMRILPDLIVFESVPNDIEHFTDKTVLMIRKEGCRPGYVILQVLHNKITYDDACVHWNNCGVLSSVLFRDSFSKIFIVTEPHGPCMSGQIYNVMTDFAFCVEFKQWPIEAIDFFKRIRKYGWPSKQLLDAIRREGCHLVPVGDKTSDLVSIQWRISFAVAERMLVHSFNHTQLRVYVLLKLFHQQVIETYDEAKDLLCSYFMKTTMFYMIEDTDQLIWREENLITLFWRCFMQLIQWVEDGYCPNYFIPENNLFKSKIFGQNQDNLVKVLREIKQQGLKSIYRCNDLKDCLTESFNMKLLCLSTDMKLNEALKDIRIYEVGAVGSCFSYLFKCPVDGYMRKVLKLLSISQRQSDSELYVITSRLLLGLIGKYMFHLTNQHNQLNGQTRNKETYKYMRLCENLLREYAKVDISAGPLSLALFYYAMNRYDKVIQICNKVLTNIKPYSVILQYPYNKDRLDVFNMYKETFCGRGICVTEKMKKAVALNIVVDPHCKMFYPKELQYQMEFGHQEIHAPAPFAIFLKFLCYDECGDNYNRIVALRDIQSCLTDDVRGISTNSLTLNLLAICHDKIGDAAKAVELCCLSQMLQPNPKLNGASEILKKLLFRV